MCILDQITIQHILIFWWIAGLFFCLFMQYKEEAITTGEIVLFLTLGWFLLALYIIANIWEILYTIIEQLDTPIWRKKK